jgi:hypothetical protein
MVYGCGEFILVFTNYPKVTPGSQIIVPENRKLNEYWEFVSIAGFWSLAGIYCDIEVI